MLMQIRRARRVTTGFSDSRSTRLEATEQCEASKTLNMVPLFLFYLALLTIWAIAP